MNGEAQINYLNLKKTKHSVLQPGQKKKKLNLALSSAQIRRSVTGLVLQC